MVVSIYYKNEEGVEFRDAVFNGTVKIVEVEEQFDAESFFMYVLMISGLCLLMFIVHYVWTTFKRGGRTTFKKPQVKIERGTQSKKKNQVDESWLPEGTISKPSPRKHTSPRNKKKGKTPDVD
jgi:translocon-associated protein subunit alpha